MKSGTEETQKKGINDVDCGQGQKLRGGPVLQVQDRNTCGNKRVGMCYNLLTNTIDSK